MLAWLVAMLLGLIVVGCSGSDVTSDQSNEPEAGETSESVAETGTEPTQPDDVTVPEGTPTVELREIIVTRIVEYEPPSNESLIQSSSPVVLDVGIVGRSPQTLDPQEASRVNELDLVDNLFGGLTHFNQLNGQVEPHLARDWDISDDGRTWTFKLRDDVFWVRPSLDRNLVNIFPSGEGSTRVEPIRPIYAEDVLFAVWRACDPNNQSGDVFPLYIISGCREVNTLDQAADIDFARIGVRALDDQTIQFNLEKPASYFLTITSLPIMKPVPVEIVSDPELTVFDDWSLPSNNILISSGPYVMSPISTLGSRIVLESNPYWPIERKGNADTVNLFLFDDEIDAYDLWEDRILDVIPLPLEVKDDIFAFSPFKLMQLSEPSVFYLAFNHESEIFSTPELRRAFSAAINRDRIIEDVYNDFGLPARHFTPPGSFGSPPADRVGVGYDPDFARQQLIRGGVTACRFLPEIRYMVNSSDASLFQAELVREMWEDELGCPEENILIEQVQFGQLLANTRPDAGPLRPDVWDLGWSGYYPDAHNWFDEIMHCTRSDGRLRRVCSPVDDKILNASVAAENERRSLYIDIENDLFSETGLYPVAPIYTSSYFLLRQTWIDIVANPVDNQSFHNYRQYYDYYRVDPDLKRIEQEQ